LGLPGRIDDFVGLADAQDAPTAAPHHAPSISFAEAH
jgi:hypothetical protein